VFRAAAGTAGICRLFVLVELGETGLGETENPRGRSRPAFREASPVVVHAPEVNGNDHSVIVSTKSHGIPHTRQAMPVRWVCARRKLTRVFNPILPVFLGAVEAVGVRGSTEFASFHALPARVEVRFCRKTPPGFDRRSFPLNEKVRAKRKKNGKKAGKEGYPRERGLPAKGFFFYDVPPNNPHPLVMQAWTGFRKRQKFRRRE
jgi:hypothetical protein